MKKLLFCICVVTLFVGNSFADDDCAAPTQWGDGYEYSECAFLQQASVTSAVKEFWGKPELGDDKIVTANGNIGKFILDSGWHCGKCGTNKKFTYGEMKGTCSGDNNEKNDQAVLAYVATDVSEHGAQFCLTQFTAVSLASPDERFFVYHQMPTQSVLDNSKLNCAWFCEPGWDGEKCMSRTSDQLYCDTKLYYVPRNTPGSDYSQYSFGWFDEFAHKDNVTQTAQNETTDPVIGRTAVLAYKDVTKNSRIYQQQVVIGMTDWLENGHGIKARPIWIGADGIVNTCDSSTNAKNFWATPAKNGKEKVLCAQGWTFSEECKQSSNKCGSNISYNYCGGATKKCHDISGCFKTSKHYLRYKTDNDCLEIACTNGMSLSEDDNFECTVCVENHGVQGRCPLTNKCVWCGVGKCFNKTTCNCDPCVGEMTFDQLVYGKNKTSKCWSLFDSDEYRSCVLGETQDGEPEGATAD